MSDKIIFLDFDGVLTIPKTKFCYGALECIKSLNHIIDNTDAKIVVSSTWRLQGKDICQELLQDWHCSGIVIDITPSLLDIRGKEISSWLNNHKKVNQFVILDDNSDMDDLTSYLVQTDMRNGLTMADAEKAIRILNG